MKCPKSKLLLLPFQKFHNIPRRRVDYCELFDSVYVRYDFFEFSSEEFWTCLLIHCIEAESDFSESLDIVQASFCCDKTKNWILFRANHQVGG